MGNRSTTNLPPGFELDKSPENSKWRDNPKQYDGVEPAKTAPLPPGFKINKRQEDPAKEEINTIGKTAMHTLAKVLGYPGGVVRTAVAYSPVGRLAAIINKKGPNDPTSDFLNTAVGNAPSTNKYLEQYGVPELGKVDIPVDFSMDLNKFGRYSPQNPTNVTGRQAIGAIGDAASDIIGTKAIGSLLESGGKNWYKKAFKKEDYISQLNDKKPISEIMYREGETPFLPSGKVESSQNSLSRIGSARKNTISEVAETGKRGSALEALEPGQSYIDKKQAVARMSPETLDALSVFQKDMNRRKALAEMAGVPDSTISSQVPSTLVDSSERPLMRSVERTVPGQAEQLGPTIEEMNQAKMATGESVPDQDFYRGSTGSGYKKAIAGGYQKQTEKIAEAAIPGHGKLLHGQNADISSILNAMPNQETQALAHAGKHGITEVDAVLAAANPELEAVKLAAKFSKLPGFYTYPGYYGSKVGQGISNLSIPQIGGMSAWELMNRYNQGQ